MRSLKHSLLILFFITSVSAFVCAQELKDSPVRDRGGTIRAGAYFAFSMRTKIRLDSNTVPIGLFIGSDQLGFESFTVVPRFYFAYRFNRRHAIDFEYYDIRRNGTISVVNNPSLDGSTLEVTTPEVESYLQSQIARVSYTWIFHEDSKVVLGLSPGVYFSKLSWGAKSIDPDEGIDEQDTIHLPLPVLGLRFGYRLTNKLGIITGFNFFFVKYKEYGGYMSETSLFLEHRTFKHVGFGGGITYFPIYITAASNEFTVELRNTFFGAVLYASFYF